MTLCAVPLLLRTRLRPFKHLRRFLPLELRLPLGPSPAKRWATCSWRASSISKPRRLPKKLTDQEPKNAIYLNKLGIALHQQEALGLALKCYERSLKADPHYADAANNIGTVWYQRKRYGKAIKAYVKAIKLRDNMPVLYSNLGYAYFGDKRYEESIAAFRIALSKGPAILRAQLLAQRLVVAGSLGFRPRPLLLPARQVLRRIRQRRARHPLSPQSQG